MKSELITHKGLAEDNFVTKNYGVAYTAPDGTAHRDIVVVTLRIPTRGTPDEGARLEQQRRQREAAEAEHRVQAERERAQTEQEKRERVEAEREAREQAEREAAFAQSQPAKTAFWQGEPYRFAVRTNLLYDAFLLPTLGLEWRINSNIGIKVDGSRSWWGDSQGKVQKVWLVSPEVRWYLLDSKRFYVGASANFGEYNIYKGMIGGIISDDTGYQGKLWNAGLTVGYQLYLSRSFSLDFNLGLGYTRMEYDSFTIQRDNRVYKDRGRTKNFWGPKQAGISLVWTIGGSK